MMCLEQKKTITNVDTRRQTDILHEGVIAGSRSILLEMFLALYVTTEVFSSESIRNKSKLETKLIYNIYLLCPKTFAESVIHGLKDYL